jgi:hypothetical protein
MPQNPVPAGVNDLRLQKNYGGRIITSCSPSSSTVTLLWPDGQQQTVRIADNPTVVAHELSSRTDPSLKGQIECAIYRRGSTPYVEMMTLIETSESELAEARRELELDFKRKTEELERRRMDNLRKIEGKPQDGEPACKYEPPHFDCPSCPDPVTNTAPRHFSSPAAEVGHRRGTEHIRLVKTPVGASA